MDGDVSLPGNEQQKATESSENLKNSEITLK